MADSNHFKPDDEVSQSANHNNLHVSPNSIGFMLPDRRNNISSPDTIIAESNNEPQMSTHDADQLIPSTPQIVQSTSKHSDVEHTHDSHTNQEEEEEVEEHEEHGAYNEQNPETQNNLLVEHQSNSDDHHVQFDTTQNIFQFSADDDDHEHTLFDHVDTHSVLDHHSQSPTGPPSLHYHVSPSQHYASVNPTSSSGLENDDLDDGDIGSAQVGRVDASTLGEVDNPLQKSGRHTVITGHLPTDNPFSIAVTLLGIKMVSRKMIDIGQGNLSRKEAFHRDLHEFLVEIDHSNYKIPVIGGGPLDLYNLAREVLLLGGVQNVVKKRAFRIVGQQLELPKSCTSAAFVLKNAYTRLLFHYEQKLVFDIYPANPSRSVNIKMIVSAEKEREKMRNRNNNSVKRRLSDDQKRHMPMPPLLPTTPQYLTDSPPLVDNNEEAHLRLSATAVGTVPIDDMTSNKRARLHLPSDVATTTCAPIEYNLSPEHYMSLMSNNPRGHYTLPDWARQVVQEQNYQAFIDAAQALDEKREVKTGVDVVLIAIAHCFECSSAKLSAENALTEDHIHYCLAYRILIGDPVRLRPAFSLLFDVLGKFVTAEGACRPILAANAAAQGLISGLLCRLDDYREQVLERQTLDTHEKLDILSPSACVGEPRASGERDALLVTSAYCSAALLDGLAVEKGARAQVAAHDRTGHTLCGVLAHANANIEVETAVWDVLERVAHCANAGPVVGDVVAGWLARAVLARATCVEMTDANESLERADNFARRGITALNGFARRFEQDSEGVEATLDLAAAVIAGDAQGRLESHVAQTQFLAYTLASKCGWRARAHVPFVEALIARMATAKMPSFGDAALVVLHRIQSLSEFAEQFLESCRAVPQNVLDVVREIVADLFVDGTEIGSLEQHGMGQRIGYDELMMGQEQSEL